MERDFMGLNTKDSNSAVVVKEEFIEGGCEDSGFMRSSEVPWKLSDMVSALPHLMPMKTEQDEKPSKMKTDFFASHGYRVKSGSEMFENFRMAQQFLGGNPLTAPHSVLPSAGTTEQRSKAPGFPAQLTIFYGGTVNVFDDISPEKAQAIMFLAGNGFVSSNMGQSKLHKQAFTLPNDHVNAPTTIGMPINLVNKVDPSRAITSIGSVAANAMISSAVPQARKASLARFLEKRKERAVNAAPYNLSKKVADCGSPGLGFSATSGLGSISKDI